VGSSRKSSLPVKVPPVPASPRVGEAFAGCILLQTHVPLFPQRRLLVLSVQPERHNTIGTLLLLSRHLSYLLSRLLFAVVVDEAVIVVAVVVDGIVCCYC
jgi:hypothetical protein